MMQEWTTFNGSRSTAPPGWDVMEAEGGTPLAVRGGAPKVDAIQDGGERSGVWVLHPGDRWRMDF